MEKDMTKGRAAACDSEICTSSYYRKHFSAAL